MFDKHQDILDKIVEEKDLSEEIKKKLKESVEEFKKIFGE